MKLSSFRRRAFLISVATIGVQVAAEFPFEYPCLQSCTEELTPSILQQCIDACKPLGHCCGNRLNGECPETSNMRLSCANGCEIAYVRSTVEQCKADCDVGNESGCEYTHPNIPGYFQKCGVCQEGCNKWPDLEACHDGCDLAASFSEYYKHVEVPVGTCIQDDIPRFLFGGQSNMEGWSNQALPDSFATMIKIANSEKSKKNIKNRLKQLFIQGEAAEARTSKNEARLIYGMREKFMQKDEMLNDHPTSTCSFTNPLGAQKLDCERPVSSTACGGNYEQYGPEFMFGHAFPKLNSPLKGQAIGIAKIAVGGTQIYKNWMKDNKDQDENYWNALVDVIKGANGSLEAFVWFQGENDSFDDTNKQNYLANLTKFVADVRQEIFDTSSGKFAQPTDIPVIIVELGRWIWGVDRAVIDAQRAFVENDPKAALVPTGAGDNAKRQLTQFYHYDLASQIIIGKRIASAMKQILTE